METSENNYLSSWIEGEITDKELQEFVSEEDFLEFQKLKGFLNSVEIKDLKKEGDYDLLQQKIANKKVIEKPKSTKIIKLFKFAAVAASIALLFGVFQTLYFSNVVSADVGDKMAVVLKDNSEVIVNSQSTLSYPNYFNLNRTLKLEGEAYFKVEKGSAFTVKTEMGSVTVLGTKFNVVSYDDYFEVVCYEGKVRVEIQNEIYILTAGEHIRFFDESYENWAEEVIDTEPPWVHAESSFKSVPIKYVITNFERQYGVKINYPNKYEKIKFSGSFTHKDIEVALKSIFTPLNLTYSNNGTGNIVVSE